jgi:hypothetical protein
MSIFIHGGMFNLYMLPNMLARQAARPHGWLTLVFVHKPDRIKASKQLGLKSFLESRQIQLLLFPNTVMKRT